MTTPRAIRTLLADFHKQTGIAAAGIQIAKDHWDKARKDLDVPSAIVLNPKDPIEECKSQRVFKFEGVMCFANVVLKPGTWVLFRPTPQGLVHRTYHLEPLEKGWRN